MASRNNFCLNFYMRKSRYRQVVWTVRSSLIPIARNMFQFASVKFSFGNVLNQRNTSTLFITKVFDQLNSFKMQYYHLYDDRNLQCELLQDLIITLLD